MTSLKKERNSTNLLLWPPICWNKPAITPKWFNSLDTNSRPHSHGLSRSTSVFLEHIMSALQCLRGWTGRFSKIAPILLLVPAVLGTNVLILEFVAGLLFCFPLSVLWILRLFWSFGQNRPFSFTSAFLCVNGDGGCASSVCCFALIMHLTSVWHSTATGFSSLMFARHTSFGVPAGACVDLLSTTSFCKHSAVFRLTTVVGSPVFTSR